MQEEDGDDDVLGSSSRADTSFALATITKLVKEELPANVKCAADVAPMVQSCLAEFLQMLTAEANEKAKAEGKNTINEAHTLFALQKLGFGHYESNLPVTGATAEEGSTAAGKRKKGKGKRSAPSDMSEEELLRMQQELFASARQSVGQSAGSTSQ